MTEKIPRQKKNEQEPQVRNKNFTEVTQNYTAEQAKLEAGRCLSCQKPACVSGCPVNVQIPQFIQQVKAGNFAEAYTIIKKDNYLPAICGRVCPQETQCEGRCVLGKTGGAVAIGNLERFVADNAPVETWHATSLQGRSKIAIIGSGPSGLTCAAELNAAGVDVTVYEALHELGGVLAYGIPEFRLPKAIVRREINSLAQSGVKFETNMVIGKIFTIAELLQEKGFSAVYIASGAGFPSFMGIQGEDLNCVYSANEYLTRINLMKAYLPDADTPILRSKRVAVVGGGNVAMDAARSAQRLGAEQVYLIYRRSRAEMPARQEEIQHAEEEGIEFLLLHNPVAYSGDEKGFVKSATLQKMRLGEPDASGRRKPIPEEGSEFELAVDAVIVAVGTQANPIIKDTTPDLETNKHGYIVVDENGKTSKPGVYAGGDIASGAATVILAMGAGKKAAKAILETI
ncbi:glutamate synthase (NADPH/NADH) small chain [Candidatus Termititenax dinenymphae]|uniref:Glutamate synthase (NADPH/NADH) small chain n=1 Tax=Candidatus Termititenax dinenymphae TaxID=2218523 RepID=A0A388TJU1_9BACT|nr:glutamate synthase (NADPH/NADH) small chain [Candidatus Termititenax dinenymphae]